jgi:acetyltransferase-like isoleucine patch superfamily enzyme
MKKIILYIKRHLNLLRFKHTWRVINTHNFTTANNIFPLELVKIGVATYGPLNIIYFGRKNNNLTIGNYCAIAQDVKFILGGNHYTNRILQYPIKPMLAKLDDERGDFSKGPVYIGHDVWIGTRAIILSGVTLGNGCVVGAGSVVTKTFPAYSIIAGNPACAVRKRFSEEVIDLLLRNEWIYELSPGYLCEKQALFTQLITEFTRTDEVALLLDKIRCCTG